MLRRFNDAFGTVDVILHNGDFVGHDIDPSRSEYTAETEATFRSVVSKTASLIATAFPDTMVLTTLGNNDGEFHHEAPNTADKLDFYDFMLDTWFAALPGDSSILPTIKDSYENAGNYRVDLNSNLAVLVINSQYFDIDDDTSYQGDEGTQTLDWLELNLS
jgi:hypothetical protein